MVNAMGVGRKKNTEAVDRLQSIRDELASLQFVLPGSLVMRTTRCQTKGCRCRNETAPQLHGPYPTWTRPVNGKTITKTLSVEQAERFGSWFDEARRLKALIAELEQLSIKAFEETET